MEISEKIKMIRKEKKLSREELYLKLKEIFGERSILPNTIWRIESGLTAPRTSSLHQICVGLGISLKDLLEGIEEETKLVDLIKKGKRLEQFVYNEKARAEILSSAKLPFLAQELILLAQGKTPVEEDPIEVGKFQKLVYCLSGKITCTVGTEKHILNKGDCLSFESNLPHYFEYSASRLSRLLIIQIPRQI